MESKNESESGYLTSGIIILTAAAQIKPICAQPEFEK